MMWFFMIVVCCYVWRKQNNDTNNNFIFIYLVYLPAIAFYFLYKTIKEVKAPQPPVGGNLSLSLFNN